MLVREKETITRIIAETWQVVATKQKVEAAENRRETLERFSKDPRFERFVAAARELGVMDAETSMWAAFTRDIEHSLGVRWAFGYAPARGLHAEIKSALPEAPQGYVSGERCYQILDVALNTCTMKWPALQSPLYELAAEMGSAKNLDECRAAITKFTHTLR